MKFLPPKGKVSVFLGLTSGHAAVVMAEGTELHARFHREALRRGCVPIGEAVKQSRPPRAYNELTSSRNPPL
jgi:hypothetical protein